MKLLIILGFVALATVAVNGASLSSLERQLEKEILLQEATERENKADTTGTVCAVCGQRATVKPI